MRQITSQAAHLAPVTSFSSVLLYGTVRLIVAAVFIYAGAAKLAAPEDFAAVIAGYGLLPGALVPFVALGLPLLEVLAGLGLVFEVRGSLGAILGMSLLFLFVLSWGLHLGLDVDCGCYGPGDPEGEAYHGLKYALVRDLILLGCIFHLYRWRARNRSIHKTRRLW